MTNNDYYDETFYLELTLNPQSKVGVQHVRLTWDQVNARLKREELSEIISSDEVTIDNIDQSLLDEGSAAQSDLIGFGIIIGKLLLPPKLREVVEKKLQSNQKIRLCLLYPEDETIRKKLLNIPWEYLYLGDKTDDFQNLLGLNYNISIVHCLNPDQQLTPEPLIPISIDGLRVQMQYLSWFGSAPADQQMEKDIFNSFARTPLESIIECTNLKNPKLPEPPHATQSDLVIALRDQHLIHVASHGDDEGIVLELDDKVFVDEIKKYSKEIQKAKRAKAVILLNCLSATNNSLALELHRIGIPIVIGITGSINMEPASRFVEGFYNSLATWPCHGLEKAVVEGRNSILKMIEGKWSTEFGYPRLFLNSQHSTLIPEDLLFGSDEMVHSFNEFIAVEKNRADRHPKTGRWQNTLTTWVKQKQPEQNWFLMTGPEGSGKSTQIAWLVAKLVNEEKLKILYHFCQIGADDTSVALAFIRNSLVPQLNKNYEGYKAKTPPGRFPLREGNEDDALWDFVIEPLSRLIADKTIDQPPVIIIDGIDAISRSGRDSSILGLLLRHRGDLDRIARFLVTADYDPDVERESPIIEDIHRLTYHQRDGKPDLAIEKVDDPLIMFKDIKNRLDPQDPNEVKTWADLYELFENTIKAVEQKCDKLATRLLDVVTITYEPLPVNNIAIILGLQSSYGEREQLKQILVELQPFFKNYEDYQDKLILYHGSLKRYLLGKMNWRNKEKSESLADAHELFVKAFRPEAGDWTKITDWKTLTGAKWSGLAKDQVNNGDATLARYMRRYLSDHAYYSYHYTTWNASDKRQARAKAFLNLVCDPRFRNVRLDEVGQQASLQDIWMGLRVINTEYIHAPKGKSHKKARVAFDRLLASNQPNTYRRNELIELEQQLRNGQVGVPALYKFLDLNTES
jgi:hypothetical protein